VTFTYSAPTTSLPGEGTVSVGMSHLVGQIDLVDPEIILGWVANTAHPECLEQVVCHGSDGRSLAFRACLPREDVCAHLSLRGRFGFAIPTSAVRSLGPVLRLTDVSGAPLVAGETVSLPACATTPRPERPIWVVLHIQKTAGTSLREALSSSMRPGEALFLYPDGFSGLSPAELNELPLAQRSFLRLVMGHAYHGAVDSLPGPVEHATFLRDPATRLRSHFRHHVRGGTAFRIGEAILPTRLVAQHALTDEFDNLMTRMVAGLDAGSVPIRGITETHVEIALDHIRSKFRFVGLVERLEEHYPALCELMGVPVTAMPHENAQPAGEVGQDDDGLDWSESIHHNRFDVMLYDRVLAEGLCGRDLLTSGSNTMLL
jgi:hypothetical protein